MLVILEYTRRCIFHVSTTAVRATNTPILAQYLTDCRNYVIVYSAEIECRTQALPHCLDSWMHACLRAAASLFCLIRPAPNAKCSATWPAESSPVSRADRVADGTSCGCSARCLFDASLGGVRLQLPYETPGVGRLLYNATDPSTDVVEEPVPKNRAQRNRQCMYHVLLSGHSLLLALGRLLRFGRRGTRVGRCRDDVVETVSKCGRLPSIAFKSGVANIPRSIMRMHGYRLCVVGGRFVCERIIILIGPYVERWR